jgi:vacuolar iron transporter family protein
VRQSALAAGEYVSVSSQANTEQADLKRERHELATEPRAEEDELTSIYVRRGLEPELARIVARQLIDRVPEDSVELGSLRGAVEALAG